MFLGPPGSGKSRSAWNDFKVTYSHAGDRWFDGYDADERVLFDDFDGWKSGISYRKLLQLTDRYPMRVPVKGGFVQWIPKMIIFTTNVHPERWYPDEDYAPLERRIDDIIDFPYTPDARFRLWKYLE